MALHPVHAAILARLLGQAGPFAHMGMNAMGPQVPPQPRLGFPQVFYTNDPNGSIGGPSSILHPAAVAATAIGDAGRWFSHQPGVLPPSGHPMDNPILHAAAQIVEALGRPR